jgi:transposase
MGKRVQHSLEFKQEAVRLLDLGQKPASELALQLGVRRNQLYKWKAQLASKVKAAGKDESSREIARLKRELRKVTEERDILKKAAAYFARPRS